MSEILKDTPRPQIIRWVAIYMVVAGILTVCGGVLLTLAGGLAGLGGALGLGALAGAGVDVPEAREAAAAAGALTAISGITLCFGLLSIVTGPAMIIVGWGLFNRARWARMGTVIIAGLSVITSLLGLLTGGGIINLLWVVISGFIAYLFYTDPAIKAEFGEA